MITSDLLQVFQYVKFHRPQEAEHLGTIERAIKNAESWYSSDVTPEKVMEHALLLKAQDSLDITDIELELQIKSLFAVCHFAKTQGIELPTKAEDKALSDETLLRIQLIQNVSTGQYKSVSPQSEEVVDKLLNKVGIPITSEQRALIHSFCARKIRQLSLEQLSKEQIAQGIADLVASIDAKKVRALIAANNLSKLYRSKPMAYNRTRSRWRWFFDTLLGSLQTGAILFIGMATSVSLAAVAAATIPALAFVVPIVPQLLIAAVVIGVAAALISLAYGTWKSWDKGNTQRKLSSQVGELTSAIAAAEDDETRQRKIAAMSSFLKEFDDLNNLSTLKRQLFLHSGTAGDTGKALLDKTAPVMTTGIRLDLVTTAITTGLMQMAPSALRKYWHNDDRWNFYIECLIWLHKTEPSEQKDLIRLISQLCQVLNFNWLLEVFEEFELTENQLKLLASLNLYRNAVQSDETSSAEARAETKLGPEQLVFLQRKMPEDAKASDEPDYTDADFEVVKKVLQKAEFAERLVAKLSNDSALMLELEEENVPTSLTPPPQLPSAASENRGAEQEADATDAMTEISNNTAPGSEQGTGTAAVRQHATQAKAIANQTAVKSTLLPSFCHHKATLRFSTSGQAYATSEAETSATPGSAAERKVVMVPGVGLVDTQCKLGSHFSGRAG